MDLFEIELFSCIKMLYKYNVELFSRIKQVV